MEKRTLYWLIAITLLTVALRITLAFLIPNLTYDSYFHLRQVEHITQTGMPLYHDELSYGGRDILFLPLFHYFAALFALFLPLELVAKLLPNLLLATLPFLVFLLSKKITNEDTPSLISAFIAGFLPIFYSTNRFSPDALFFPLILFTLYCFLHLSEKKYLYLYLTSFILLSLTSSATVFLLLGMGIYILLAFLENKSVRSEEKEVLLFSLFAFLWIQVLFFKKIFLNAGISFIWQNVPSSLLQQYFPKVSILSALILVSIIPFLAGIWVVYRSLFQSPHRKVLLLISLVLATTFLSWLQLVRFEFSLAFFSLILAILFASFYQQLQEYLQRTKFPKFHHYLLPLTIVLLLLTLLPPALSTTWKQQTPVPDEIQAFLWLRENTPKEAGILALLEEGHLVTYYSQRHNLMDDQFSRIDDIDQRFQDLNSFYTTRFQTQALKLLDQYQLQYLVLTPAAASKYSTSNFNFLGGECFKKIYSNETKIYLVKCSLKEQETPK
ncbi:MAG: glycosyltransferase family 39 protein [Nanoarchaeota archaeon]